MRLLVALAILALVAPAAPTLAGAPVTRDAARGNASDGFPLEVRFGAESNGGTSGPVAPPGLVDAWLRYALDNYEEYLALGFHPHWTKSPGLILIDDSNAYGCTGACEIGGEGEMRIVVSAALDPAVTALWEVEPTEAEYRQALGHEMFHAFQFASGRATTNVFPTFTEGTARLSETLHAYSWNSHQPRALVYAQDKDGCNGFDAYVDHTGLLVGDAAAASDMDYGMSVGPFTAGPPTKVQPFADVPDQPGVPVHPRNASVSGNVAPLHSYDACYFWLAWYGAHGARGLVALLDARGVNDSSNAFEQLSRMTERATGTPIALDVAAFAQASLTGRGYAWNGLDWGEYLDRWAPATLEPGGVATETLADGGLMARAIGNGTLTLAGEGAQLYLVRDDGTHATTTPIPSGTRVTVAPGERAWAVAIYPHAGRVEATIGLG